MQRTNSVQLEPTSLCVHFVPAAFKEVKEESTCNLDYQLVPLSYR